MTMNGNNKELLTILENLCPDDFELIINYILNNKLMLFQSTNSIKKIVLRDNPVECCSHCGSSSFVKNGKTKKKVQKYLCKDCGKTFCATTNKTPSYSKRYYRQWHDFIEAEVDELSLRNTAMKIGISKTTAFNWRHKIHKAAENFINSFQLSGKIEIDPTYIELNFKGTRPKNMKRPSKKRKFSEYRGLSKTKVCIVCAIDENDHIVLQVAGLGKESIADYNKIKDRLSNPSLLITDQAWGFTTFAKDLNCELDQIPTTAHKSINGNTLANVSQIQKELKEYISNYHGVATKYLQGYLNMFILKKMFNYKYDYDKLSSSIFLEIINSFCILKVKDIKNIKAPYDISPIYQTC